MKPKTLLLTLGLKKAPKYSASFGASHPVNGMFYLVQFTDGKCGLVCDRRDGTFVPQVQLVPMDRKTTFVSLGDAAEALYRGLVEYGNPWNNRK